MARWEHYDLTDKWNGAGALVYGCLLDVKDAEVERIYAMHYEDEDSDYAIAIWPQDKAAGGWRPCVLGSGDLYFDLESGENRWRKLEAYPPTDLQREQDGLPPETFDWCEQDGIVRRGRASAPAWHLVASQRTAVALYFGVLLKPGKAPAELPAPLTRARGEHQRRAHSRVVIGARLCVAPAGGSVQFDPSAPEVAAAGRALHLHQELPRAREAGFIILPTDGTVAADKA